MESEVARLRHQIETELEGMQRGFSGFAVVSKHTLITKKYHTLGAYQEQLALSIGEASAAQYVCEAYMRIVK